MTESTPSCWKDVPGAPEPGFRLARFDEIPDGGACLRGPESGGHLFGIILLRSDRNVFAYVNRCAHFGVPLAGKVEHLGVKPHQSISCSVHYARYRWHDGVCVNGECMGESLLRIPVAVVGGDVVVADVQDGT